MTINLKRRGFLFGTAGAAIAAGVASTGLVAMPANAARPSPKYGPSPDVAKLNANENPYGPSREALIAMQEATANGAYYVNDSVKVLQKMIAERNGVDPEYVALGSGSSAALVATAINAAQKGDILAPDLFWDTTSLSVEKQGIGKVKRLPKHPGLEIDLEAMLGAVDDSIGLVQVVNPNNPTGLLSDPVKLKAFCIAASKKATVLVDEAYNELTDDPDGNTMVSLVKAGHDVIVARTFSKIYGLAGMRVGYIIASPKKIEEISRYGIGWYGLNQAGVAAAVASYDNTEFMDYSRSKIREGREMLVAGLKANGLKALPSQANFLFVDLGKLNADAFQKEMAKEKVLIRGIYRDYTNWSRVSVGRPEHVQMYLDALPKVLERLG